MLPPRRRWRNLAFEGALLADPGHQRLDLFFHLLFGVEDRQVVAEQLEDLVAVHARPRFVDELHLAREVGHRDAVDRLLDRPLEHAHRLFGQLALGDFVLQPRVRLRQLGGAVFDHALEPETHRVELLAQVQGAVRNRENTASAMPTRVQ